MTKIKFDSQKYENDVKKNILNPKAREDDIQTNKIKLQRTKPDYKPINKIEHHIFEPQYTPKNKIKPLKLSPNYKTRNKIELPHLKPNYKPINKIKPPKLLPKNSTKNKIRQYNLPNVDKSKQELLLDKQGNIIKKYSTLWLIEILRKEVGKVIPRETYRGELAYWKLSKYIYDKNSIYKNSYVEAIRSRIKSKNKKDYNPKYKFSMEVLDKFKKNLEEKFGNKANSCTEIINRYRIQNPDIKDYPNQQYHKYHPNLKGKARYFKNINTIPKSYWYGILSHDGSIQEGISKASEASNRAHRIRHTISLEISAKDIVLLKQFCNYFGLEESAIKSRLREKFGKKYKSVYISFNCRPMVQDLENLGFASSKAERKDFPKFKDVLNGPSARELKLAYLRGAYDADGFSGRTSLSSSSKEYLEKIKDSFNITYPVRLHKKGHSYFDSEGNLHVRKSHWILTLGAHLLNNMTNLCRRYNLGLKRKTKEFSERNIQFQKLNKKIKKKI